MAKHDFYLDEDGNIDIWRIESDYHNGPECRRCGKAACHHCDRDFETEECHSSQMELF